MRKLLLVLLTAITGAAMAQQPTPQTLDRFLNAYQFEPIRESWAFKLDRDAKAEIAKWYAMPGMTPQLRSAVDKYQATASAELQRQMSSSNLRPRYVAIFGKVFTEQEMQEITRFYESPAGKASVAKRPQIAALIHEQLAAIATEMDANLKGAREQLEEAARKAK